jgi:aspartyl-tRNA(Asn)/glutamyl-tRNA(Gln) amidotransferase subunit A
LELTHACLERIADLDNKLHSFLTLTVDRALQEARQADQELNAGLDKGRSTVFLWR